MALESDVLLDRRRLKRRLTFWRVVAVVAVVAGLVAQFGRFGDWDGGPYVARLTVSGVIVADPDLLAAINRVQQDDDAQALIVHVDSPGGTVAGGESLYRALTRLSAVKPVVAVMDGLATSAGYMIAIGASRVVAQRSTITGSIGVILQSADVTGLLDRIGVNMETIKSSPLKGVPSPFEPLTEEGREATKRLVEDMYDMFVEMVVERRQLPREKVLALADGRVFTGRQAFESGLIDGIGGEREARLWLRSQHDIDDTLPLRDVDPRDPTGELLERLASSAGKALLSERLSLDGMISVWHPEN